MKQSLSIAAIVVAILGVGGYAVAATTTSPDIKACVTKTTGTKTYGSHKVFHLGGDVRFANNCQTWESTRYVGGPTPPPAPQTVTWNMTGPTYTSDVAYPVGTKVRLVSVDVTSPTTRPSNCDAIQPETGERGSMFGIAEDADSIARVSLFPTSAVETMTTDTINGYAQHIVGKAWCSDFYGQVSSHAIAGFTATVTLEITPPA